MRKGIGKQPKCTIMYVRALLKAHYIYVYTSISKSPQRVNEPVAEPDSFNNIMIVKGYISLPVLRHVRLKGLIFKNGRDGCFGKSKKEK